MCCGRGGKGGSYGNFGDGKIRLERWSVNLNNGHCHISSLGLK